MQHKNIDEAISLHTDTVNRIYNVHFSVDSPWINSVKLTMKAADKYVAEMPGIKKLLHENYAKKFEEFYQKFNQTMNNIGAETQTSSRMEAVGAVVQSLLSLRGMLKDARKQMKKDYKIEIDYTPINNVISECNMLINNLAIKKQQEVKEFQEGASRRSRSDAVTAKTPTTEERPDVAPPIPKKKSSMLQIGRLFSGKAPKPETEKRAVSAPAELQKDQKDNKKPEGNKPRK